MKERKLRNIVGTILIAGHLIPVVYLFSLQAASKFTGDEVTPTLAVMAPLFLTYLRVVIAKGLEQKPGANGNEVAEEKVAYAVGLPVMLFLAVLAIISWKAFGSLSFLPFISTLGGLESILGFGVAMVARELFGK
jgi:hypothetical protein